MNGGVRMIYYLAHPYSGNPNESIKNAFFWMRKLRDKGYYSFSPVAHTHYYHEYWKKGALPTYEDYVDWDLQLLEALMKGDGKIIYQTYYVCAICQLPMRNCKCVEWEPNPISTKKIIQYDSTVTVLLSRTAYHKERFEFYKLQDVSSQEYYTWNDCWGSDGCRQEYEFAKAHHIRVLELEAFLEGEEVAL